MTKRQAGDSSKLASPMVTTRKTHLAVFIGQKKSFLYIHPIFHPVYNSFINVFIPKTIASINFFQSLLLEAAHLAKFLYFCLEQ